MERWGAKTNILKKSNGKGIKIFLSPPPHGPAFSLPVRRLCFASHNPNAVKRLITEVNCKGKGDIPGYISFPQAILDSIFSAMLRSDWNHLLKLL